MRETHASNLFGLSSGAVIALEAALVLSEIERLALYEPPLKFGGVDPVAWAPRYRHELARGRLASAFVTTVKGTGDSAQSDTRRGSPWCRWCAWASGPIGVPVVSLATRRWGISSRPCRLDASLVDEAAGPLDRYAQGGCRDTPAGR
jgi:hypothetical protein